MTGADYIRTQAEKYLVEVHGNTNREARLKDVVDQLAPNASAADRRNIERMVAETLVDLYLGHDRIIARCEKLFQQKPATKSLAKVGKLAFNLADYLDGESEDSTDTTIVDPYAATLLSRQGIDVQTEARRLYALAKAAKRAKPKGKGGHPRDLRQRPVAEVCIRLLEQRDRPVNLSNVLVLFLNVYSLATGQELLNEDNEYGRNPCQVALRKYLEEPAGTCATTNRR